MMEETVTVCPECDSPSIARNSREDGRRLRCASCLAKFDEPVEREPKADRDPGRRSSPATRALLDADPEEVTLR